MRSRLAASPLSGSPRDRGRLRVHGPASDSVAVPPHTADYSGPNTRSMLMASPDITAEQRQMPGMAGQQHVADLGKLAQLVAAFFGRRSSNERLRVRWTEFVLTPIRCPLTSCHCSMRKQWPIICCARGEAHRDTRGRRFDCEKKTPATRARLFGKWGEWEIPTSRATPSRRSVQSGAGSHGPEGSEYHGPVPRNLACMRRRSE